MPKSVKVLDGIDVLDVPVATIFKSAKDGNEYVASDKGRWVLSKYGEIVDVLVEEYANTDGDLIKVYEQHAVQSSEEALPSYLVSKRNTPPTTPPNLRKYAEEMRKREDAELQQLSRDIRDAPKKKRGRPTKERRCTREPTAYNLFVRSVMQEVKDRMPDSKNAERMVECARLWQEHKKASM